MFRHLILTQFTNKRFFKECRRVHNRRYCKKKRKKKRVLTRFVTRDALNVKYQITRTSKKIHVTKKYDVTCGKNIKKLPSHKQNQMFIVNRSCLNFQNKTKKKCKQTNTPSTKKTVQTKNKHTLFNQGFIFELRNTQRLKTVNIIGEHQGTST